MSAAELFVKHGVTHMIGMDAMYERMIESRPEPQPFPKLAPCPSFGANPPLESYLKIARARGLPICAVYGMSEVMALFSFQSMDYDEANRVIGGGHAVHPETEIRVYDPDTDAVLPIGEEGEAQWNGHAKNAWHSAVVTANGNPRGSRRWQVRRPLRRG